MRKTDSVVIDPVKMNIVNRIAAGSRSQGQLWFSGGLLLQGHHVGDLDVRGGPLVVVEGASVTGKVVVHGDVYLFGSFGSAGEGEGAVETEVTVYGVMHLTSKSEANGHLRCEQLATYDGAKINGKVETLPQGAIN